MAALSELGMIDGPAASGAPVKVMIGRAESGAVVFDTDAASGVIVAVGEAIRGRSVQADGDGS